MGIAPGNRPWSPLDASTIFVVTSHPLLILPMPCSLAYSYLSCEDPAVVHLIVVDFSRAVPNHWFHSRRKALSPTSTTIDIRPGAGVSLHHVVHHIRSTYRGRRP